MHKKCELPDNITYKKLQELKNTDNPFYICKDYSNHPTIHNCRHQNPNLFENLDENNVGEIFDHIENPLDPDVFEDLNYKIFQKRGLHFVHVNVNSLLLKIEEVKIIAVIGISEAKLYESVLNDEIKVPGYNILRSDRNRHDGVLCYVKIQSKRKHFDGI